MEFSKYLHAFSLSNLGQITGSFTLPVRCASSACPVAYFIHITIQADLFQGEDVRQMNRLAPKPLWNLEETRSFLDYVCEAMGFWQVDVEHGTY